MRGTTLAQRESAVTLHEMQTRKPGIAIIRNSRPAGQVTAIPTRSPMR